MAAQPRVSVVIPHQAGAEILLACLESITRDTSYFNYEICVVDNGSSDGSVESARQRFPEHPLRRPSRGAQVANARVCIGLAQLLVLALHDQRMVQECRRLCPSQ